MSNISGAVTNTFTLDMAQGGKYIAFFVTPKNANGTGTATRSAWHYVNAAPTIQNLVVKNPTNPGVFAVDETIEANFTYSDLENNPEGTHIYQWYRATTSSGTGATVISGATSKQYTLVQLDKDEFIGVSVIPVATTGSSPGNTYQSPWYLISEKPTAVLTGKDTVCSGGTGHLTIQFNGTAPWSFKYKLNGGVESEVTNINDQEYPWPVTGVGTYVLTGVKDSKYDNYNLGDASGTGILSNYQVSATLTLDTLKACSGIASPFR